MKSTLIKANYQSLIFEFRGYKVMIDFDLAALYGVETKRLKEQVRRNLSRFPKDFMFELTKEEYQPLRSQFATLKRGGHSKYPPFAFTEQGVAMLSSVINSEKAIQINIEIMRTFARYRAMLRENEDLKIEIKTLDNKFTRAFKLLLDKIDALHQKKIEGPRKRIGYKNFNKEK